MAKQHRTDGRLTIWQIAQLAGVSVVAVSTVMHGRPDVARPTRERVEQTIEQDGGFVATKYLINLGHRRIACIGKSNLVRDAIERIAGYRAALDTTSLPSDPMFGLDNHFFTKLLSPPLRTVHAPRLELGRTAATMLFRQINGKSLKMSHVVLSTEFVERQSCRPLPS